MPAEWEPHEATWLVWPHNEASWPGQLKLIPPIFAKMAAALSRGEKVHILANSETDMNQAVALLLKENAQMANIDLMLWPTNDSWIRDSGPLFITRTYQNKLQLALTNWEFNKWGGKYPPWELDNQIPEKIGELLKLPVFNGYMVLEGGSIDVNGAGTLLTSEQCLLHPNRNPQLTKELIEERLKNQLGVRHIVWLGLGIEGDDTDGHIDDIARFVAPDTIVCAVEDNEADENYGPLMANYKWLKKQRDQDGNAFKVLALPMPGPVVCEEQRLPASYANFYIGNKVVLLPVFDDPNDAKALAVLQRCFPTREIVAIPARDLVWGLGTCHCLTQQQPRV